MASTGITAIWAIEVMAQLRVGETILIQVLRGAPPVSRSNPNPAEPFYLIVTDHDRACSASKAQ